MQPFKLSEIIKYTLDHREPFLIPEDCGLNEFEVENDWLPEFDDRYDERQFFCLSKTLFAKWHGVAPAQISRWIKAGMPVMKNGRLHWFSISQWLESYKERVEYRRSRGWQE